MPGGLGGVMNGTSGAGSGIGCSGPGGGTISGPGGAGGMMSGVGRSGPGTGGGCGPCGGASGDWAADMLDMGSRLFRLCVAEACGGARGSFRDGRRSTRVSEGGGRVVILAEADPFHAGIYGLTIPASAASMPWSGTRPTPRKRPGTPTRSEALTSFSPACARWACRPLHQRCARIRRTSTGPRSTPPWRRRSSGSSRTTCRRHATGASAFAGSRRDSNSPTFRTST
jgi:hypothetical protein